MLNGFAKHRPLSTIEYEQQLDYLCQWMEKWSNQVVRLASHAVNFLKSAMPLYGILVFVYSKLCVH